MVFNPFYSVPFDYWDSQECAVGEHSLPRLNIGSTSSSLSSGLIYLTMWTAMKTEFVTQMSFQTGSQAASATPTFCGMAVYQCSDFSGTPNFSLLGATANDTTMYTSTFTEYIRSFTNGGFWKYQGQRYAVASLIVSGVTLPNFIGYNGTSFSNNRGPRLNAALNGQSSFPANIASGSIQGVSQLFSGYVSP
jgi:hypothetical protein